MIKLKSMENFSKYEEKLKRIKEKLESKYDQEETIVYLCIPPEDECKSEKRPIVKIKFCIDEKNCHDRKIELFNHYLELPEEELLNQIEAFIEEFRMEIEQSEYGGG